MNLREMFLIFYWNCSRQEYRHSYDLEMLLMRRFPEGKKLHEANEQEFNALLKLCRLISAEHPEALKIDELVSYQDPLDKKIGRHNFAAKLNLNHVELENLFQTFANK